MSSVSFTDVFIHYTSHCVQSNHIFIFNKIILIYKTRQISTVKMHYDIISANKTQGPNAILEPMNNNIPGNISRGIDFNYGIPCQYGGIFGQYVYFHSAVLDSNALKENTSKKRKKHIE